MQSTIDDIETKKLAMQTVFIAIFVFRILVRGRFYNPLCLGCAVTAPDRDDGPAAPSHFKTAQPARADP